MPAGVVHEGSHCAVCIGYTSHASGRIVSEPGLIFASNRQGDDARAAGVPLDFGCCRRHGDRVLGDARIGDLREQAATVDHHVALVLAARYRRWRLDPSEPLARRRPPGFGGGDNLPALVVVECQHYVAPGDDTRAGNGCRQFGVGAIQGVARYERRLRDRADIADAGDARDAAQGVAIEVGFFDRPCGMVEARGCHELSEPVVLIADVHVAALAATGTERFVQAVLPGDQAMTVGRHLPEAIGE